MKTILLIISLVVTSIGFTSTILDYKRSKTGNPEAVALLGKRIFVLALVIAVLNAVVPLINHFKPSPPPPVTEAQVEKLFVKYIGEKLENPPVEEVKIEIEKELQVALKKKEKEALGLYQKGRLAYDSNRFTDAISFFSAALEIVKIASFHLARGNGYSATRDFKLAIQDYEVALLYYQNSEDREMEGVSLFVLGRAYYYLRQHDTAISYYTPALVIFREIGNRQGEGNSLSNMGSAYHSLGQYDKAMNYYTQALKIFEEIKSPYAYLTRKNIAELEAEKD